jgi:hypothetical protein
MEVETITRLSEIAPKWRQYPHIKVALKEHLNDMSKALETGDGNLRLKEATDLVLVLQSFLEMQATDRQANEMWDARLDKFESTGSLPPLA